MCNEGNYSPKGIYNNLHKSGEAFIIIIIFLRALVSSHLVFFTTRHFELQRKITGGKAK